ncbi:putative heat shock protein, partial [Thamnocephalis sphaerospora]
AASTGIDFGNLQSVLAVARNRGIDVICNEVSSRATPSLVSFGPKQRYLGESAKTNEVSNFRNTIAALKRLAGRRFDDPEVQNTERRFITAELCDMQGQVGVKVDYLEKETTFSAIQLISMYLAKLRDTAVAELQAPVNDVVISVPGWFTDAQRRALLDAAEIAGLNCLRLINDTTAAALGYGITKTDLPEDKPRTVVFTDMGHSSFSVAVVEFKKGQLTVKGTAFDPHLGGRYFDELLCNHFCEEFKGKYKIDVKSNGKAMLRLRTGCERLKKVLSANMQAPLNVENLMNDRDVSAMMNRSEFEELAAHLFDRIEAPLREALAVAGVTVDQVDAIELVGGSVRIPAVKERLAAFFGKELSTTLNQDEAVARGCALQCAMLSPAFRVREFAVHDITPFPVKFTWPSSSDPNTQSELDVFAKGNSIPSAKILTFYRKEPFDIDVLYASPETLPAGASANIARFTVKDVVPTKDGELSVVRVKARLNIHGVVSVDSAHLVEEITKEMDTDEKSGESGEAPPAKKSKKIVKKHEIPVSGVTGSLANYQIAELSQLEGEMHATDKLVIDTAERRNSLEEYVYEIRGKVEMQYSEYVPQKARDAFMSLLNDTEDWLYGDGEDATKSVYVEKLTELRKHGDPIAFRFNEANERPAAVRALREAIDQYSLNASGSDARFEHIPVEEKQQIVDRCIKAQQWLEERLRSQEKLSKDQDPVVRSQEILQEREALVLFASPILSKPKPKPEPTPEPTPASEPAAAASEESANPGADMEVD